MKTDYFKVDELTFDKKLSDQIIKNPTNAGHLFEQAGDQISMKNFRSHIDTKTKSIIEKLKDQTRRKGSMILADCDLTYKKDWKHRSQGEIPQLEDQKVMKRSRTNSPKAFGNIDDIQSELQSDHFLSDKNVGQTFT